MKSIAILITAGFSLPLGSIVIQEATPILRQAVAYQEETVRTYEYQFPDSEGPARARAEWEPKKVLALARIESLEILAKSITEPIAGALKPHDPFEGH